MFIAERQGFEPRIPFWGIHAFQACLFNHSSTSPFRGAKVEEVFGFTKCFVQIINQKIYYIRILQVKNRKRLLLSKIIITFALPLMYDNKCDICNGKALSPRRCVYRIYCQCMSGFYINKSRAFLVSSQYDFIFFIYLYSPLKEAIINFVVFPSYL